MKPRRSFSRPRLTSGLVVPPANDYLGGARPAGAIASNEVSDEPPDNVRQLLDWLVDEELRRWRWKG